MQGCDLPFGVGFFCLRPLIIGGGARPRLGERTEFVDIRAQHLQTLAAGTQAEQRPVEVGAAQPLIRGGQSGRGARLHFLQLFFALRAQPQLFFRRPLLAQNACDLFRRRQQRHVCAFFCRLVRALLQRPLYRAVFGELFALSIVAFQLFKRRPTP